MGEAKSLIGKSGDVAVHLLYRDAGDPAFVIEAMRLGELIDLHDLATAREVYHLLGLAILKAEIALQLAARGL